MSEASAAPKTAMQRVLDAVERVGNMVPHPVLIFLALIAIVIVLSQILAMAGVSVTQEVFVPSDSPAQPGDEFDAAEYDTGVAVNYHAPDQKSYKIEQRKISARSLLNTEGIRFIYSSLIPSFMGFTAVGLMIAAMIGAGVAEESGLVKTLIRKLVIISPPWALTYILAFVGIVSSIAADAGYLVLIPLAGIAFMSVGRHPIAGLALAFAAVAGAFTVNMLIKPLDAVLVEFTNDAIALVDPSKSIGLASNLWFSIASVIVLTLVIAFITERLIEPRLGKYVPAKSDDEPAADKSKNEGTNLSAAESRGLLYAGIGLVVVGILFALLALPAGAPLRDAETGVLIGNSPFMNGLIAMIMVLFLVTGAAYGYGAGTLGSLTDIIKAMEKAMSGLGGLILLFFVLAQFVAYFNYTNMGTILALSLADTLKTANFPALVLLLAFILVVALIDLLITGAIAKWALFAPVFVPLLMELGVLPDAVLAAYRIADSPINSITPLNAYFALVVGFCQRYDKNSGVGTVVSLMLPYVVLTFLAWTILFVIWHLAGLPWGV
ncbi:MAG: AbgT family transporter [Pirellulaceae bacterium]|nr:AbgT family transporter [Pirellulaceae bacterium]